MRDFRDAKLIAKSLRADLADDGYIMPVARSLEVAAHAIGFDSWNVLSARIKAVDDAPTPPEMAAAAASDPPLKLAQIELGCTDLDAARAWYGDVLGLPCVGAIPDSIFVRCGEVNLIIQKSATPRRGRTVYFGADGRVREATAALKARGVAFSEEPRRIGRLDDGTHVWLGFFEDPWGNPFGLLCNMPPEPI